MNRESRVDVVVIVAFFAGRKWKMKVLEVYKPFNPSF